ncbi:uncharacterized protein LOC111585419 [Amphiprion ocellaris]|uniref:uncharacterized protein LOC111585419 n=1 Tax=Amphiprion ocellaris TaxID=80972 RepID=UPI0024112209|nr:uncharacterized protein LOC111585419 [Amphiprion ocellaris]
MQSLKAALYLFVTQVTKSVGVYTAATGIFIYHVVFDKDFECTCKVQAFLCPFYMILPAFIIFFMLLWLDGSFQAILKYSCLKGTKRFCWFLLQRIIRAVFISLLWPMSVLIDGDWFICCIHEKILNCTESSQMSTKDLKIKSRITGFGALLCIIFLAACLWPIPWRKCCTRQRLKDCCCGSNESKPQSESESLGKDVLFKLIVLEEGENLLTKKLTEVAKGKIDEKFNEYAAAGEWEKCCGVLEEIVDPPKQNNNPNPPPDRSQSKSSKDKESGKGNKHVATGKIEEGSDAEKEPIVQSPPDELPSKSSPNEASTSL